MAERTIYLAQMGSRGGPAGREAVYVQPMAGVPGKLERLGEGVWLPEEVFQALLGGSAITLENGLPHEDAETGVTCPERVARPGPWEPGEGLDSWHRVGADRCCSFCGSIHPEDLGRLLDDPEVRFEMSTKGYKLYIHRPAVPNAGFGAIKFYNWHGDQALVDRINERLSPDRAAEVAS